MNFTRSMGRLASIAGILVLSSVLAFGQSASSPAPSQEMGRGMMGSQGMMGGESGMMGGPGMMGGAGGMMGMPMMQMMSDPKTRGQMMEIQGRMMKEMGELMIKRGQELEQGK